MAGFLYFLANTSRRDVYEASGGGFNREMLQRYGIANALRDVEKAPDDCFVFGCDGPAGKTKGVLLYPRHPEDSADDVKYLPSQQTWSNVQGDTWIGWYNERPPEPQSLERKTVLGAKYCIRDSEGRRWDVPTARTSDCQTGMLPVAYQFDQGEVTPILKTGYRDVWSLAVEVFNHLRQQIRPDVDRDPAHQRDEAWQALAALRIMSQNYRIDELEANMLNSMGLELFDLSTVTQILFCFVDNPKREEYEQALVDATLKKTKDHGGNSPENSLPPSPGLEEDCLVTTQR